MYQVLFYPWIIVFWFGRKMSLLLGDILGDIFKHYTYYLISNGSNPPYSPKTGHRYRDRGSKCNKMLRTGKSRKKL